MEINKKISKIFIGADHTGVNLKKKIISYLEKNEIKAVDLGVYTDKSSDYPDIAEKVAFKVLDTDGIGILICGTGIGMSISANKIKGIRGALIYNKSSAKKAKKHNDSNIFIVGAREMSFTKVQRNLKAFLNSEFEFKRHSNRLIKIKRLEDEKQ